jgi:hypothetical protein
MSQQSDPTNKAVPFKIRLVRMLISIGVLTFITVIFGYGG